DGFHVIQREAISAGWISVAEGAGEVTLVGEPKPERNRGIRRPRAGWDGGRFAGDVIHEPFSINHRPSKQTREALCVARDCGILWPAAQLPLQFKNPIVVCAAGN